MQRSTLILGAVLVALVAYIYWFEREPISELDGELLFDVEEEAILTVELREREEEPRVLEKHDGRWRLVAPVAADTDSGELDSLLQNLTTMTFDRVVARAPEVDLADYGLDSPALEVLFRTEEGERGVVFGADTPTGTNQYARRLGDDAILVLASYLSSNFDRTAWDLRDKAIFHADEALEATRAELARPKGRLVIEKDGDAWRVVHPLRSRADRFQAAGLVSTVRNAEMQGVVLETLERAEDYGLAEPDYRIRIELEGEGAGELELDIGNKTEIDYYAKSPSRPELFIVEGGLIDELDKEPAAFYSKRLFHFTASQVERFEIFEGGELRRRAEKKDVDGGTAWASTAPGAAALESEPVEDLLYELTGTSADAAVEAPELGPADFKITVWAGEPETSETLSVFEVEDGSPVYAVREGDAVALELSRDTWQAIEALLALRAN